MNKQQGFDFENMQKKVDRLENRITELRDRVIDLECSTEIIVPHGPSIFRRMKTVHVSTVLNLVLQHLKLSISYEPEKFVLRETNDE